MKSISPVFTEAEVGFEVNVAEDQPEYLPIIGLPVSMEVIDASTNERRIINPWGMAFRFRLNDEERAAVLAGKDLILMQLNFGNPITPMNVQFCEAGEKPAYGEKPPEEKTYGSEGQLRIVSRNEAISQADGQAE